MQFILNKIFRLFLGLEYLCSLEELDVAYNCISRQDAVLPLSALPYLVNLCLESNPISFSKDYRTVILQRVCTAVNKKRVKKFYFKVIVVY
jgi:hypothetical protein